jgi:tetratricopeptide (TPR) repeat protein
LQRLKQYPAAEEAYAKALELNPQLGQIHLNRGLLYLELQQLDKAEADFVAAKPLLPDNEWPERNLQALAQTTNS